MSEMKRVLEKLKMGKEIIVMVVGIITFIITCYKFYEANDRELQLIQKTTLRTMIWSEGVPIRDKIEACDSYLALGYNSETKMYCEKLLEKEFK